MLPEPSDPTPFFAAFHAENYPSNAQNNRQGTHLRTEEIRAMTVKKVAQKRRKYFLHGFER
jgi:hypothetical protein